MASDERHREERARWFGENVRRYREQRDMSQGHLAREMTTRGWRWHTPTVFKVEQGIRRTEAFETRDLAEVLGIPIAHLFWSGPEANEAALLDRAIVMVRQAHADAVLAAERLLAARGWAEAALAGSADSPYQRVRAVRAELEAELGASTLGSAVSEGTARHENPEG